MRSHWGWLVASALLATRVARAEDVQTRAEVLFRAGITAGQQGQFDAAIAALRNRFGCCPRGSTLRNLAKSEIKQGRLLDGVRHLKQALGYADLSGDWRDVAGPYGDRRSMGFNPKSMRCIRRLDALPSMWTGRQGDGRREGDGRTGPVWDPLMSYRGIT